MKFLKTAIAAARHVKLRTQLLLTRPSSEPKVFCIGFNKTGTTSAGRALKQLGFRHSTFNRWIWRRYQAGDIERVLWYASRFESFDDLPWLSVDLIPVLDREFPGSRFILLERPESEWVSSFVRWTRKIRGREADPEMALNSYREHRRFCQEYFADRPDDLLCMSVQDDDAFTRLAHFVGREAPSERFPHVNVT